MSLSWNRVSSLTRMTFPEQLRLSVQYEARKHLSDVAELEILGKFPRDENHKWFWDLERSLTDNGQANVWEILQNQFGQNLDPLYIALKAILEFEAREISWENANDETLAASGLKLTTVVQVLGGIDTPVDPDQVVTATKEIFNELANVEEVIRRRINKLKLIAEDHKENLGLFIKETERLLSRILNMSFLAEVNPTRFVETGTPFGLQYSHWLGNKFFQSQQQQNTIAQVSILNSEQAASVFGNPDHYGKPVGSEKSGTLQNFETWVGPGNVDGGTGHLKIEFPMCIVPSNGHKNPVRKSKSIMKFIWMEKFCLICEFTVELRPNLTMNVWTISQPIIVGSKRSDQEFYAKATILWDDILCEPDQPVCTMTIQNQMPCARLIDGLDRLHREYANVSLSDINRAYLMERIQRRPGTQPQDLVSFEYFCETHFNIIQQFTFYEWFMASLELGRTHFRDMWSRGFIFGFLSRQGAINLLTGPGIDSGTMLMHFSESMRGGLAISWVNANGMVLPAGPLNDEFFRTKANLTDTIAATRGTGGYQFVYPNQLLDQVLANYPQSMGPVAVNGYVGIGSRIDLLLPQPQQQLANAQVQEHRQG